MLSGCISPNSPVVFLRYWLNGALLSDLRSSFSPRGSCYRGRGTIHSAFIPPAIYPFIPHIFIPHIFIRFRQPLICIHPTTATQSKNMWSSLPHFPGRLCCMFLWERKSLKMVVLCKSLPLLEHNLEAKWAMPCHVSSQCVQYCCRSKRRHKHRPVSIGLSVSRRDFIRNLSTGISIRNQGSSRICAEIFAATFAVDFLSRGRNRQMWISAHTDRASGGIAPEIQKVFQWKYWEVFWRKYSGSRSTALCVGGWEHLGIWVKICPAGNFTNNYPP